MTNVFLKPRADKFTCMPRRENNCCEETNVFLKPKAAKKTVFTLPMRENDCFKETNNTYMEK